MLPCVTLSFLILTDKEVQRVQLYQAYSSPLVYSRGDPCGRPLELIVWSSAGTPIVMLPVGTHRVAARWDLAS